jgi:signal transduction histidine kinase
VLDPLQYISSRTTRNAFRATTAVLPRGRLGAMGPRPTRGDWVVAAVLTVLCALAPRAGPPATDNPAWVATFGLVLAVVQGLPTAWRRIRPALVAAIVVPAYLIYALVVDPVPPYAGWVVLFAVIVHSPERRRAVLRGGVCAATLIAGIAVAALMSPSGRNELPTLLLITVVVVLAAALTRAERGRIAALRERADSLEREQDAVRAQAALEERLRVARDLHDVVGHGLSAISVQSGTARVALDAGQLPAVRTALVNVESTSREALQEMRQLLGVLRDTSSPAGPADLTALVAQTAGARATVSGDLSRVPPIVGLCAYRVVQEALTNATKHAPGAKVAVSVATVGDRLIVNITDDGSSAEHPEAVGIGHGLLGMRERVEALNGVLDAGPTQNGGWRVRAELPLAERDVR